jgi:DNA-binding response OmpR family regulator
MPVMDGFQVLEEVKYDTTLQHVPIIVISADDDLDSIVRCIEMGAADHLPRLFNPVVLRTRISACVGKKRSHDRKAKLYDQLQQRYQELQELQNCVTT